MNDRVAEIGIVGAGPAGARAAELLAGQGLDVVLFDPAAPWEKPCGGGLTPPLFGEVPELDEIKERAFPVERAWIEAGTDALLSVDLHDRIWIVSRRALGAWQLGRAVQAGAVHRPVKVDGIERRPDGWTLRAGRESWSVSFLVGADGAASTVRHEVAPSSRVALVPARLAYPDRNGDPDGALVLRFYRDIGGYLWDFPRPDHRSVGIEVTKGSRTRAAMDRRIDDYGEWSEENARNPTLQRTGAVIGTPARDRDPFRGIAGPGFALLGDAAGLADPFTGEGIRNAFRSAELLARAHGTRLEAWPETYRRLARETLAGEFAMAGRLRRWLSETGVGVRLIERAMSSDVAYGVMAAILEAVMVQDYRLTSFAAHWRRAFGEIRAEPSRRVVRSRAPERTPRPA